VHLNRPDPEWTTAGSAYAFDAPSAPDDAPGLRAARAIRPASPTRGSRAQDRRQGEAGWGAEPGMGRLWQRHGPRGRGRGGGTTGDGRRDRRRRDRRRRDRRRRDGGWGRGERHPGEPLRRVLGPERRRGGRRGGERKGGVLGRREGRTGLSVGKGNRAGTGPSARQATSRAAASACSARPRRSSDRPRWRIRPRCPPTRASGPPPPGPRAPAPPRPRGRSAPARARSPCTGPCPCGSRGARSACAGCPLCPPRQTRAGGAPGWRGGGPAVISTIHRRRSFSAADPRVPR
jgi:hypothetical protein